MLVLSRDRVEMVMAAHLPSGRPIVGLCFNGEAYRRVGVYSRRECAERVNDRLTLSPPTICLVVEEDEGGGYSLWCRTHLFGSLSRQSINSTSPAPSDLGDDRQHLLWRSMQSLDLTIGELCGHHLHAQFRQDFSQVFPTLSADLLEHLFAMDWLDFPRSLPPEIDTDILDRYWHIWSDRYLGKSGGKYFRDRVIQELPNEWQLLHSNNVN